MANCAFISLCSVHIGCNYCFYVKNEILMHSWVDWLCVFDVYVVLE